MSHRIVREGKSNESIDALTRILPVFDALKEVEHNLVTYASRVRGLVVVIPLEPEAGHTPREFVFTIAPGTHIEDLWLLRDQLGDVIQQVIDADDTSKKIAKLKDLT
jgi:hypothetical protein